MKASAVVYTYITYVINYSRRARIYYIKYILYIIYLWYVYRFERDWLWTHLSRFSSDMPMKYLTKTIVGSMESIIYLIFCLIYPLAPSGWNISEATESVLQAIAEQMYIPIHIQQTMTGRVSSSGKFSFELCVRRMTIITVCGKCI